MTETLFSATFLLAAPFWGLMIVASGWAWTRRIVSSPWIAAPAALLYLVLVLPNLGSVLAAVSSPTLPGLQTLLATPEGAAIAWAHFIAFDVFVGRWLYLDSRERRLHPLVMAPILVLTILLAPIGYLVYLLVRSTGVASERPRHGLQPAAVEGLRHR